MSRTSHAYYLHRLHIPCTSDMSWPLSPEEYHRTKLLVQECTCPFKPCRESYLYFMPSKASGEVDRPGPNRCGFGRVKTWSTPKPFKCCGWPKCGKRHKREDSIICGECNRKRYCSPECYKLHWAPHGLECEKTQLQKKCDRLACPKPLREACQTKLCSHCKDVRYCSVEGQEAYREKHRPWCLS